MNLNKSEEIFHYFTTNHKDLVAKYQGQFIVLSNNTVTFAGDSFEAALEAALSSGLKPGEFLIQECTEGDSAYSQFFSSLAVFA